MKLLFILLLVLPLSLGAMDFRVSGYGSIVGGKVISGDKDPSGETEFQIDFYDYAYYVEKWEWDKESLIALQLSADVNERLTATMQLVAKGADGWSPDIDWFYGSNRQGCHLARSHAGFCGDDFPARCRLG